MSDVMDRLVQARRTAWEAGLELERLWQAVETDLSAAEKIKRQQPVVDRSLEALRDALTLDGAAPRPSLDEAKVDVMRWGVDEGLISIEQYDDWVTLSPKTREIENRK